MWLLKSFKFARTKRLPRILAVGFSHVHAVNAAYELRKKSGSPSDIDLHVVSINTTERYNPFYCIQNKALVYNRDLLADLEAMTKSEPIDLIAGFFWSSQHFTISALNDPRPFDFILPGDTVFPDPDPKAEIVPFDLFRAQMNRRCETFAGLATVVKDATSCPVCLVSAPPPIADLAERQDACPPVLREKLLKLGIAPASLRYKSWKLWEQLFREQCLKRDVAFVPAPPRSFDDKFFLRNDYAKSDWIHANAAYGELVLNQLSRLVAGETLDEDPSLQKSA